MLYYRAVLELRIAECDARLSADEVGTELPPQVELRPVPDELAARVPEAKNYRYAATNDRVLLVGTSRIVAGVFAGPDVPVNQGRR